MNADGLYEAIFKISSSLEVPVVVLALLSLAWVLYECGSFLVESYRRRRRNFAALSEAAVSARSSLDSGDRTTAMQVLEPVAWSPAMATCYPHIVEAAGNPGADTRIRKELADFDFDRQRRLGRTRLLVRVGPALGLMGTLIPLAPALDGLANGDIDELTNNLQIAFSITVLGLLVGALAFALSLVRDRIYGQDYSDLEYVSAVLTGESTATENVTTKVATA